MSDIVDFDPPAASSDDEQADVSAVSRVSSLNARAVLPNGKNVSRAEILANLGLNPNTSPTAWLAIIGCGSNASALLPGDLQRVGINKMASLSKALSGPQAAAPSAAGGFTNVGRLGDAPSE